MSSYAIKMLEYFHSIKLCNVKMNDGQRLMANIILVRNHISHIGLFS